MLFRDSASSTQSSADPEEYSNAGSLTSSQSYATRAFENKMRLLAEEVPIIDLKLDDDDDDDYYEDTISKRSRETGVDVTEETAQIPSNLRCETDTEWSSLMRRLDCAVQLDTHFYEYPPPEHFKSYPPQQVGGDEHGNESGTPTNHHVGAKIFLGGLRFEVVQIGRHMISWIFEVACGVRLPPNTILVHRKTKGGRSGSPTGCASVFVACEEDVEHLLAMNQRVFCGEKGIHVASSAAKMAELISSKAILDITDGRVRGPTHPVIIERAYGSAGGHHSSRTSGTASVQEAIPSGPPPPYELSASPTSSAPTHSSASSLHSNASVPLATEPSSGAPAQAAPPALRTRPLLLPGKEPIYHVYPGDAEAIVGLQGVPKELSQPADLFTGGFSPEVGREFIAWTFDRIGVRVHPGNVTLYADSQPGDKGGCALVQVEECEVHIATAYTKRILCEARGVYITDAPNRVVALLASRDKAAGPARPLIIRKKAAPKKQAVGGLAQLVMAPPPPPPFPNTPETQWGMTVVRPPPPPYMQNVFIGNQAYQIPAGASIQLQLVPVITSPVPVQVSPPVPPPPPIYAPSHAIPIAQAPLLPQLPPPPPR